MSTFLNKESLDALYKFELHKHISFPPISKNKTNQNKTITVDFSSESIKKLHKYNMFSNIYVLYTQRKCYFNIWQFDSSVDRS